MIRFGQDGFANTILPMTIYGVLRKKEGDAWLWKKLINLQDEMVVKFGGSRACRDLMMSWGF